MYVCIFLFLMYVWHVRINMHISEIELRGYIYAVTLTEWEADIDGYRDYVKDLAS